jgi:protein-tyrosine phosphatase
MFSLFKSNPYLKDLIPSNYVDIHSHLLPGIDDGSENMDNSIYLINKMIDLGFDQFTTTPHVIKNVWNNSKSEIENLQKQTILELKKNNINLEFKAAAEYMMDMEFVNLFQSEKLLTLKDNYVLVEMSYINPPIQLYQIIFDLQIAGYIPVLAHPERYSFYTNNFTEYFKLKKAGCFFQLNLLSTVGYYGPDASRIADKLLLNKMYDFVGSDIHHDNHVNSFNLRININQVNELEKIIEKNQFFRI